MDIFNTKCLDGNEAEFGWLLDNNNQLIPGGYYDANGNRLHAVRFNNLESVNDYQKKLAKASLIQGKRILILSYEIELNDEHSNYPDYDRYIRRVMARILSGGEMTDLENAYYYKISANEGDFIPDDILIRILNKVNTDFVITVGDELIYRLPLIKDNGPKLVIQDGLFADTFKLSYDRQVQSPVICVPIPHPCSPGFSIETEQKWHNIIVELYRL